MRFYLGSDHAGFRMKEALKKLLEGKKIGTVDLGAFGGESVDYPDYALKVARRVASEKGSFGLLVCGTGIGMSIAANKINGIRAANPFDAYTARVAREHNGANVLCLGGRTYPLAQAKKILNAFLKAKPISGQRHRRRVGKIWEIENKEC